MVAARLGIRWEELLLDRTWPAFIFVLIVYGNAVNLIKALVAVRDGQREVGLALTADLAHQAANVVFLSLVVVLFIIRKPPVGARSDLVSAAVALAGTFALNVLGAVIALAGSYPFNLVAPAPQRSQSPEILLVSTALTFGGTLVALIGLLTLGRCFGIFPEARGLVTRGPYRLVRHPVYLGEFISGLGLLLPVLSVWTVAVYLVFVVLQVWRIFNEEHVLSAAFPEYEQY